MENSPKESQEHEDVQESQSQSVESNRLEGTESAENSVSVTESASTLTSPGRKQLMMAINQSLQSIDPDSLLKPIQQCIYCSGDDKQSSFSVYGNDVSVFPSDKNEARTIASNKIRTSQVCKFDWEQRYYYGNLVASNKSYVAYVVGVKASHNEHVRVINHHTSSRVLLKGFEGKVTDVEFGGPEENHLACLDESGNLRIFLLFEEDDLLKYTQILEVTRPEVQNSQFSLVSWAPVLVDEDVDEEEHELMIAVSRKETAEVYSVNTVIKHHGSHCSITDIAEGLKIIENGHAKPITKLVISPNLEVLATSSLDGCVKFWEINFENKEKPSCLHDWQPHDGNPVTSLFFCDNHFAREEMSSSWHFLITGADFNNEIKVWCAVSWKCLQVIRFCADHNSSPSEDRNLVPRLKPALDKSAMFFILTDITRRVLYLLQLYQNAEDGTAHFSSLTECILTQPMLNVSLYDTKAIKKAAQEKNGANSDDGDDNNDDDDNDLDRRDLAQNGMNEDDNDNNEFDGTTPRYPYSVSLKMFAISTKALQKLHIKYSPSCSVPPATPSVCTAVSSDDLLSVRDGMSDITEGQSSLASDLEDGDSFATANLKAHDLQTASVMPETAKSSISSITTVTGIQSPVKTEEVKDSTEASDEHQNRDDEVSIDISVATESEEKKVSVDLTRDILKGQHDSFSDRSHDLSAEKSHDSVSDKSCDTITEKSYDTVTDKSYDSNAINQSLVPALEEASPVSTPVRDSKPRTGTFKILKRPTAESNERDQTDNKKPSAHMGNIQQAKEATASTLRDKSSKKLAKLLNIGESQKKDATKKRGGYGQSHDDSTDASSVGSSVKSETLANLIDLDAYTAEEKEADNEIQRPLSKKSELLKDDRPSDQISKPLERMMTMLQQQQQHIMHLSDTVKNLSVKLQKQTEKTELAHQKQTEEREQMKVYIQLLQKNSSSNLNKAVKEVSKACSQRLDSFTSSMQTSLQQAQDKQMQTLLQAVNNSVTGKLDKLIKSEMKMAALPTIQKLITLAMDQISNFVAEKLAAVEKTLREEVSHLVRSKSVAESIGFTAATILEGTLPNAYREAFQNVLIPSYEDACKDMFNQINKAFEKGTQSYIEKLNAHLESSQQKQTEKRDPVLGQLKGLVQTLEDTADRLTGSESNLETLMKKQMKDIVARSKAELITALDDKMSQNFLPSFEKQIGSMLEQLKDDVSSSIRSIAATQPGQVAVESSYFENIYETIDKYLNDCDYENAFKTALTASDLEVVVYVCRKVDHEDLFTKHGSSLNQPIILSLIQQLSAYLSKDTEIKGNYLLAATCELDHKNEITAEHMPSVLGNLIEQVDQTIQLMKQNDPDNPNIKQLKSLSQIANKLLML